MIITSESWDFIEKYLPNYHDRDDVWRQSRLQVYLDGHDSELSEEVTKDEAEDELHHILYNLHLEAIDAYTKAKGTECEECKNQYDFSYCPVCGKKLK